MHQFANMPMTTQSRMQQIDTLANYPMGTKPDSFRLIKKTFKSGEPMKTKIICFIAFVSYTFYLTAGDIYVSPYGNDNAAGTRQSPLQTLEQAIKQAREWRRLQSPETTGGINILLEEGIYPQYKSLFIRPEDSGTTDSPTRITAVPNARVVLSGGVPVTGWEQGCKDTRIPETLRNKIWVAEAPRMGNRILETRQMWVNGTKAQRAAQFPDGVMERMIDFNPEEETITIPTPQTAGLNAASQVEMIVHQRWAIAILRVKEMITEGANTIVRFHDPESRLEFAHPWPQPVIDGEKGNSSFCLVNALELLDQPGEWYQDYPSGRIYYYPRPHEDMTKAQVIIPALETLLTISGTLERPVRNIHFQNISFEHTSWMRPSYQGHVTLQGGFHLLDAYRLPIQGLPEKAELENQAWIGRPEAAIQIKCGNNINFNHCTFQHLAATGVDYERAVSTSIVENCHFTDIGGTALLVGTFPDEGFETHVPYTPFHEQELCTGITIRNNLIEEVTNEDWGGVGIGAGYVKNIHIVHNEVCHVNYSGICVGWGWTLQESGMSGNRIEANYVHHFARRLYDAGGLYTLSNQPGSVMRNNRIEHLIDAPYATNDRAFYIYFDEATDGYTVENNWCPSERFDSNRPGPHNVWKKNGPQVDESIKQKAGRVAVGGVSQPRIIIKTK